MMRKIYQTKRVQNNCWLGDEEVPPSIKRVENQLAMRRSGEIDSWHKIEVEVKEIVYPINAEL